MMKLYGHLYAFLSVFFWSALYVSTKILLESFTPLTLLIMQFIVGYTLLILWKPKRLRTKNMKEEVYFILAGLFGITIYNLFLNLAMDYSLASNVSVIIATAPLFTGIFSFILKIEKPYINFFIGFCICIVGIFLLSFNGNFNISINPLGDFFAIISAIGWGIYAVIIARITKMNYDIILTTRRVIFYGIVFIIPAFFFLDIHFDIEKLTKPINFLNLLFLGVFSSGICFIIWNKATQLIGAVKTNIYVYLTPIITIVVSMIVLDEKITFVMFIGIILTLLGVILSEYKNAKTQGKKDSL
ncbi:EamA family transporter [Helicobacter didelphidarum]|uniref:EamA family transporter n=2 Tax=Helicobacter didelphidarum TaxID=2040648 RepID=A0A3D8IRJ6_9HELI|nr:EamA family transporter [Helicobacter didelphidarum]